ncbi:hypothetical protein [Patiriisocius hiemis]|uniref:Uncharacterized protein n=1 Tax=Patiriisocius hiemis TaxID=3075604 RepID=A0ABU2YFI4_9FLAO|nr:hypothetical protein [Constantimarinum sp. W242]MDT0556545.1 hypothetical protein [Constantimarinum sp. W242]
MKITLSPVASTIYGNSIAIAYGIIDSEGGISVGYGITSVNNSAVGMYEIEIDLPCNAANTVVSITSFIIGLKHQEFVDMKQQILIHL